MLGGCVDATAAGWLAANFLPENSSGLCGHQRSWPRALEQHPSRGRVCSRGICRQKELYLDTAKKCRDAGVLFMPVVLEAQGGMSRDAAGIVHKISAAVAEMEHTDTAKVREEFLQHLALIRTRSNASAIARRRDVQRSAGDRAVA